MKSRSWGCSRHSPHAGQYCVDQASLLVGQLPSSSIAMLRFIRTFIIEHGPVEALKPYHRIQIPPAVGICPPELWASDCAFTTFAPGAGLRSSPLRMTGHPDGMAQSPPLHRILRAPDGKVRDHNRRRNDKQAISSHDPRGTDCRSDRSESRYFRQDCRE